MSEPVRICLDAELGADATRVRFEGRFLASIRKADTANVFVSHVPLLDVYSQGRTEQEAIRAIESAVRLYVITAYRCRSLGHIMERRLRAPSRDVEGPASAEYMRIHDIEEFPDSPDVPAVVKVGAL